VASYFFAFAGLAHSASGNWDSPASPSVATASGDCSKATALEVAKPFFVWGSDVRDPITQVLCGPFTGAGSDAMAVTFTAPTCWPVQGWAVYRFTGGDWQLVTVQRGAFIFPLAAVGADIRETAPVFRSGDPRCIPSGGTHARIWHWDGSSLVAGSWKQVTKGKVITRYFSTPSKNIFCVLGDSTHEVGASCWERNPPQSVKMDPNGRLKSCHGRRCLGCGCWPDNMPTLRYGRQITAGRFRCLSQRIGASCTVIRTGRGFLINSSGIRRVGP
jgi:hypothetical protein